MQGVYDEEGVKWIVRAGDPGRKAVSLLERRGYRYIVLTRGVLSGKLDTGHPPAPVDLILAQRLHDCTEETL